MQTEQETFIQQCKENNKKFVKVFLTSIIQLIKIEFDNSKDCKDIKVKKYQHHGKISFPLAQ